MMENLAQIEKLVDDKLSIPVKPIKDDEPEFEFEFEFVMPRSPESPADQLFLNGRLLPHEFPCPPPKSLRFSTTSLSRSVSGTSSVSSKDSLMSWRSNSTSSRSSSSASASASASVSARTSTIDVSERRVLMSRVKSLRKIPELSSLSPQHKRWHYVTQTPVLNRKVSRKSRAESGIPQGLKRKKRDDKGKRNGRLFWRICSWFVSTCNECHALHP